MRIKKPDHKNALSLILQSEREMKFTLTLNVNENSSSTIVRNIYECFRMIGDAILISQGLEITNHINSINALLKIKVNTDRPLIVIETLRRLRHNINYYGYHPTLAETNDAISIAKSCYRPILGYIKTHIIKSN